MAKRKHIKCVKCERTRPSFAVTQIDCDKCRPENNRKIDEVKKIEWEPNDIIAMAKKLLTSTDWTQMPDAKAGKADQYKTYRQSLRAIIKRMENGKSPTRVKWPKKP